MPTLITSGVHSIALHYDDVGSGQPVVMIHGWPLSRAMWESQVNALTAAGFRCITYDRRGFGDSDRPNIGYDYDTLAGDLHDLLTHLELHNVVLVGFSMGGGEVARYLGHHGSEHIAKAAFLGSVTPFLLKKADNPDGVERKVFDEMLAAVRTDRIGFLEKFFVDFYNADAEGSALGGDVIPYSKSIAWSASAIATQQCIVSFGTTDFRADLRGITIPTLIVHGDADRIVPFPLSGARTHAMIPSSQLEVLQGAPHGFVATHAAQLNRRLVSFLRS